MHFACPCTHLTWRSVALTAACRPCQQGRWAGSQRTHSAGHQLLCRLHRCPERTAALARIKGGDDAVLRGRQEGGRRRRHPHQRLCVGAQLPTQRRPAHHPHVRLRVGQTVATCFAVSLFFFLDTRRLGDLSSSAVTGRHGQGQGDLDERIGIKSIRGQNSFRGEERTMQAVWSKPPESSTEACAAFHATACTFPLWCVSVWSHTAVVTSHTCRQKNGVLFSK